MTPLFNDESAPLGTVEATEPFAQRVIRWQQLHGRHDLPWQTPDAYRVWLSEIMLQQTQVATVRPYFLRFVERYPTVQALAAANEDEVLALWSGLGYYARGRNLLRAAREVVTRHGGEFPPRAVDLASLPGVGRSTAGAVAALAFDEREAILDGNVKRVLTRHAGVRLDPASAAFSQRLWTVAEERLPEAPQANDMRAYTQGMMDLGATVCVRTKPHCLLCPVSQDCVALRDGATAELPLKRQRKSVPQRTVAHWLIWRDGRLLLQRRPPAGVWGGLWALPETANPVLSELLEVLPIALRISVNSAATNTAPPPIEILAPRSHGFTHFQLNIDLRRLQLPGTSIVSDDESSGLARQCAEPGSAYEALPDHYRWYTRTQALALGLPAVLRRVLEETDVEVS